MITIPVEIQGLKCFINDIKLKPHFEMKKMDYGKIYGGPRHGQYGWHEVTEKMYKSVPRKGFWVGYGGVEWLNKHSKEIKFDIKDIKPKRDVINKELLIPDGIKNSPKFKVNGKERFYFFEALEACFKNPTGTIKLPTGTGKTEIQLTLAYNQSKYVGTGMILVPTLTIKDQFLQRAKKYNIPMVEYNEFSPLSEDGTIFVTTHHILCEKLKDKNRKKAAKAELDRVDWVLVDECAHATCDSWFTILMNLDNCQRCHGFSALPVAYETETADSFSGLDTDDARTIGILGSILYEKTAHELKDFLNIPTLVNIKYQWPEGKNEIPNQFAKDWQKIRKAVMANKDRTEFISKIIKYLLQRKYKTATFVKQKKHANQILESVNEDSMVCWFGGGIVFDQNDSIDLDKFKENFGEEYFGVALTSHGIEGLDFDSPLNILVLHDGKSVRQTVQMGGRVVRPDFLPSSIFNICDRGCNILPKHSNARANDIINEFNCEVINCATFAQFTEALQVIEERHKSK